MLEKSFKNEELGIEMNSFIDNKQNIWFRGKDVANILGYKNTDDAIRRHVSTENKMIHLLHPNCSPRETQGQENNTKEKRFPPVKHRVNEMTLEENIVHSSMSLVFMNFYLVLN